MPKSFPLANTRAVHNGPRIAVIIPCRDEAATIAKVISDFRRALPEAQIYVCDNNSTDGSAQLATAAGAQVYSERLPGKGHVVRRMFSDVEADIYFLVDGDDTYDHQGARQLMQHLEDNSLDMVVGARVADSDAAYRPGHRFGNILLTRIVAFIFGDRVTDMLSGYRVFSRRFVKSFPALSTGFEIETELTIHALELRMPIDEVQLPYADRPEDSSSKLNTFRDGWRILRTILLLAKEEKPLAFFSVIFGVLGLAAAVLAWPLFVTYLATG
ncbi:MAG: glycosyltransferase family 2 protein, partial [Gammaproteobacteria bacterium]